MKHEWEDGSYGLDLRTQELLHVTSLELDNFAYHSIQKSGTERIMNLAWPGRSICLVFASALK